MTASETDAPSARIVRISGQIVELHFEGHAPKAQDLFVGVDDPAGPYRKLKAGGWQARIGR